MDFYNTFIENISDAYKEEAKTAGTQLNAVARATELLCTQLTAALEAVLEQHEPTKVNEEYVDGLAKAYGIDTSSNEWQGYTLQQKRYAIASRQIVDTGSTEYYKNLIMQCPYVDNILDCNIMRYTSNVQLRKSAFIPGVIQVAIAKTGASLTSEQKVNIAAYINSNALVGDMTTSKYIYDGAESVPIVFPDCTISPPYGRVASDVQADLQAACLKFLPESNWGKFTESSLTILPALTYLQGLGYKIIVSPNSVIYPLFWDVYTPSDGAVNISGITIKYR